MNFREKLQTVFQKLNLTQKAKDSVLTNEDWQAIVNSYQQEYQTTLQDDMAADENPPATTAQALPSPEQVSQLYNLLSTTMGTAQQTPESEGNATEDGEGTTQQAEAPTMQQVINMAVGLQSIVAEMSTRAAADNAPGATLTTQSEVLFQGSADRTKFLFGIENPMFSMNMRCNKIAANPSYAAISTPTTEENKAIAANIVAYSASLAERFKYLHDNQMLQTEKLSQGAYSNNYEGVTSAGLGDQHVVMRQDALIARVLAKRDLTAYFPVRYGISDRDLVFNAFFTEVSQSYQEGEVWKGSMKLENEMGYVDDAMIKMKFGPMKELERMYIAYLNKEGSDPIKWSMIEFCILNALETAQVEQNKRRMRGIYLAPESGVAGSFLNASTGVLYTLIRLHHENKLLLNDDSDFASYTATDMLDAVQAFHDDVTTNLSEDMDLDSHVIYLNKTHQPWWIKNIRTKYGKDIDFAGPNSYLNVIPDTNMRIIWLPYLGQLPLMFMQQPGNMQFLEFVPGEMLGVKIKEDMELAKLWSTWKEGCSPAFVGRNCASLAEMKENNYDWQQIFMNKPSVALAADATTADAKKGFWFETGANTAAKALTDITNAKVGVAYIVECASTSNATTIAKSGKFASITAAYTPTAVGDYIMLALGKDSNFRELERCVGGVRKINKLVQPNIPGGR